MVDASEFSPPNIGYLYHYPRLDHPSDNFRLDIYMLPAPTEQHFDVQRSHFYVATQKNSIQRVTIRHPWSFEKSFQVCAGLIVMDDWKGKNEEAFAFGGRLKVESNEYITTCGLASSVPILEISGATPLHALFIEEIEVLLAERKAAYFSHQEFETQLIKADPLKLYRACLEALILKFEHLPHKDEKYFRFLGDLWMQKHRLKAAGLAKYPAPNLNEIL